MNDTYNQKYSHYFLINISTLLIIGIIMVYSSSYIYAKEVVGSSTHFFFKQILFVILASSLAYIVSRTKTLFWIKSAYFFNGILTIFLFCTLFDFSGLSVNGSSRWIVLSGVKFQPGEFVKISIMLASVKYFTEFEKYSTKAKLLNSLHLIFPLIFFISQPDFGTFSICVFIIGFVGFLSEFPRKYFYSIFFLSLVSMGFILVSKPYRVKRLLSFLDPWSDPQSSGFQIIQSYLAFANGAIMGQGLGNSNEKLFYLPEAYNDFIFSVIGEELGFLGVLVVVLLFIAFIFLGLKLSISLKDKTLILISSSVVFMIGIQVFFNMGVVLGLLPTKGLNLPMISYGGSSMLANFWGIGLIYSCLYRNSLDMSVMPTSNLNKS